MFLDLPILTKAVIVKYPEDFPNYLPSIGHELYVDLSNKTIHHLYGESVYTVDGESQGYFPIDCLKILKI